MAVLDPDIRCNEYNCQKMCSTFAVCDNQGYSDLLSYGVNPQGTQGFLPSELFHSTSLALLGSSWVPKKAENLKEHECLGLSRCFSVRIKKSSKTSKIVPKTIEKRHFLVVFQSLIIFSCKTVAQT